MTPPILPLDATNLCSWTNLGIVGAWMLFPDDEQRRWKFIKHMAVEDGLERLSARQLNEKQIRELVLLAREATPSDEFVSQRNERDMRGVGAGLILYNACIRIPRGEQSPVGNAVAEVAREIWGRRHNASKHANDAVWSTFKPVASLWAALVHRVDDSDVEVMFPCSPKELPQFLAIAEGFREIAEKTIPPRRKEPVLPPNVSLRLPDNVRAILPIGTLKLSPTDCSEHDRKRRARS
jgi:hypothetical protein